MLRAAADSFRDCNSDRPCGRRHLFRPAMRRVPSSCVQPFRGINRHIWLASASARPCGDKSNAARPAAAKRNDIFTTASAAVNMCLFAVWPLRMFSRYEAQRLLAGPVQMCDDAAIADQEDGTRRIDWPEKCRRHMPIELASRKPICSCIASIVQPGRSRWYYDHGREW